MTKEIIWNEFGKFKNANILSCGDLFNGTIEGEIDCKKCKRKVTKLSGKLLNIAIESCLDKIKMGQIASIFPTIKNQMQQRQLSKDSEVYQIFARIMECEGKIQDEPPPEEEKMAKPEPKKESFSDFLKKLDEQQGQLSRMAITNGEVVLKEMSYYKENHDALSLEFQGVDPEKAAVLSFSLFRKPSGENCAKIVYDPKNEFVRILREEGFLLRYDSTEYIAEGDEAYLFWDLLKEADPFTIKHKEKIETFFEGSKKPKRLMVDITEEDFAGPEEMGLVLSREKPVITTCYHLSVGPGGLRSDIIKYVSDSENAPLRSFQLNRLYGGKVAAIIHFDPDSSFIPTLRTFAQSYISAKSTSYLVNSAEFPKFWVALQNTRRLTQAQVVTISRFIGNYTPDICKDWIEVTPPERPMNPQAKNLDEKDSIPELRFLTPRIGKLFPAIVMSLEKP